EVVLQDGAPSRERSIAPVHELERRVLGITRSDLRRILRIERSPTFLIALELLLCSELRRRRGLGRNFFRGFGERCRGGLGGRRGRDGLRARLLRRTTG